MLLFDYTKNLTKSIIYSAVDVAKDSAPSTASFAETNNQIFKEVYHSVRDYRGTIDKFRTIVKGSKVYEAVDVGFNAVLEDLATGNFYNKQRIEEIETGRGNIFGGGDDDFGEFEVSDGSGSSSPKADTSSISIGERVVADTVAKSSQFNAEAISRTVAESSRLVAESQKSSTNLLYVQTTRLMDTLKVGVTGLAGELRQMNEFNVNVSQAHAQNSKIFFETSTKLLQDQNVMLKELLDMKREEYKKMGINKAEKEKKQKININDVMDINGMPDIARYFGAVKENAKNVAGQYLPTDMLFGGDNNMLLNLVSSPLSFIPLFLVKSMIAPSVSKAFKDIDSTISGMFSTAMAKLGKMGKDDDSSIFTRIFGQIFGIRDSVKSSLDTKNYEKGPVPFDGVVRKSIIEVIPGHLSRIESLLSGKTERVYDYQSGKWKDTAVLKEEFESIRKNSVKNAFSDLRGEIDEHKKRLTFNNRKDKEKFDEDIEKILTKIYSDGGAFSPNSGDEDDYLDYGVNEINMKLFKKLFNRANKRVIMGMARNVKQQRVSENKYMEDLEQQGSIYGRLFDNSRANEHLEKDRYLSTDRNVVYTDSEMNIKSKLVSQLDNLGHNVFYYLQNMYRELTYLRKYGTGIGGNLSFASASDVQVETEFGKRVAKRSTIPMDRVTIENIAKATSSEKYRDSQHNLDQKYSNQESKRIADLKAKGINPALIDYYGNDDERKDMLLSAAVQFRRAGEKSVEKDLDKEKEQSTWLYNYINDTAKDIRKDNYQKLKDSKAYDSEGGIISKLLKAETLGEKFAIIKDGLDNLAQSPATVITTVIGKADQSIYDFFYGKESDVRDEKGNKIKGFFDRMVYEMKGTFNKVNSWIDKTILEPIKKKLDADTMGQAFKNLLGNFGIDVDGIKDSVTKFFVGDNGVLTPIITSVKDTFKEAYEQSKNSVKKSYNDAKNLMKLDDDEEEEARITKIEKPKRRKYSELSKEEQEAKRQDLISKYYNGDSAIFNQFMKDKELDMLNDPKLSYMSADLKKAKIDKLKKDSNYMKFLDSKESTIKKTIEKYSKKVQSDEHKEKYNKFKNQLDSIKSSLGIPLDMDITSLMSKQDPTPEEEMIIDVLNESSNKNITKRIIALEEMTSKYAGSELKVAKFNKYLEDIANRKIKLFKKYNTSAEELKNSALDKDGNIKEGIRQSIQKTIDKNMKSMLFNKEGSTEQFYETKADLLDLEEIAKKPEKLKDENIITYLNTLEQISKEFNTTDPISKLESLIRFEQFKLNKTKSDSEKEKLSKNIDGYREKLDLYKTSKMNRDKTVGESILETLRTAGISNDRDDVQNFVKEIMGQNLSAKDIGNNLTMDSLHNYAKGSKYIGISKDITEHLNKLQYEKMLPAQDQDDIASVLGSVETTGTKTINILTTTNDILTTIGHKLDGIVQAILSTGIGTHADGSRYITKTGLTAISEGEMIIPAEQNPFNPNRNKVNKKQEQRNEKQVKSDFAKELADSIYGNIRENSDGSQTIDADKKKKGTVAQGFDNFKAGTSEFTSIMFGGQKKVDNALQDIGNKVKSNLPKGIAGGLLGGALGLVTGFAGPLVAAIGGSAISIASTSDKFQSLLFGDKIYDKDGNEKGRDGGLISKEFQDTMKKYLPDLKAYGISGTLLGLVTPFGPLGGLMIGSTLSYVKNNDKYREMFFGDKDGLINKDRRKLISDAFPNVAAGAIGTILLGPFGILGNAALGTGIGLLSTTDEFKDLMLGEMGQDGKRKGGIAEAMRLKVVDPLATFASKMQSTLLNFIKKDMVEPLKNAIAPLSKDIKMAVGVTFTTIGKFVNKIFETSLGKPLDMLIKEKIISPVTKLSSFIFKAVTKPAKAVVSAPFKLIGKYGDMRRSSHIKNGNADYMTANERIDFRRKHNMSKDSMTGFDEMIANASSEDINEIYRNLGIVKGGTDFLKRHEAGAISDLGDTVYREERLSPSERTKILEKLHAGDLKSAHEIIYNNKNLKFLDKDKLAKKATEQAEELRRIKYQKQNYTGNKNDIYEKLRTKYGITDIGDHNIKKYLNMLEHEKTAKQRDESVYEDADDQYKSITDSLDNNSAEIIKYLKDTVGILSDIKEGKVEPTETQKEFLESMGAKGAMYRKNLGAADKQLMEDRSYNLSSAYGGLRLDDDNKYSLIDNKDRYEKIISLADNDYKFKDLNTLLKYNETQLDRIVTLANFGYDINDYDKFAKMSDQGFNNVLRLSKLGYKFTDINKIANLDESKIGYLEKMYKAGYTMENMSLDNQLKSHKNERQLLENPEKFQEAGNKFKSSAKEDDSINFIGKGNSNSGKKQTRIEMTPEGPLTYVKNLDGSETLAKTKDNQMIMDEREEKDRTQKGIFNSITSLNTNLTGWVKGFFGDKKAKKDDKTWWEKILDFAGTGALIYGAVSILPEINNAIKDGKSAIVGALNGIGKMISDIWNFMKKKTGTSGDDEESAEKRIAGGVARMYMHGTKPSNFIPGIGKLKYAKWGVEKAEQAGEFAVRNGYKIGKAVLQGAAPVEAYENFMKATGLSAKGIKTAGELAPEVAKLGYRGAKALVSPVGDMVKYGAKGAYALNSLIPGMKPIMDTGIGYAKAGGQVGGYIVDGLKDKAGNIVSNIAEKGTGMMNKVSSSLIPGMKTVMDTGAGYAKAGNLMGGYIAGGLKDKVSNLIGGNLFQNMAGNIYGDLATAEKATAKALGNAAVEGVESAADSPKIAMVMGKIKDGLSSLLPKLKPYLSSKEAGKAVGSLFDNILEECAKRLPKCVTKVALRIGTVGVMTAIDAFAGFISGYQDCNSIFGITHGATDGMKLASGLIRALNNACLFGIIPEKWIMNAVIDYIGPACGFDMSTLQQLRSESEAEVAAYNADPNNNTDYTVEQYNKKVLGDKTIFERFEDSEVVKFVKDKASAGASAIWEGIKTGGAWAYDNIASLIGGIVDLGAYVGNTVKSQVEFAFNMDNTATEQELSKSDSKDSVLSPIKKVLYYGIRASLMMPSLVVKAGSWLVQSLQPFVEPFMKSGSAIADIISKDWESAKAGDTGNMWNWNYADGKEGSFSTIANLVGIGSKLVLTPISMFNAMTDSIKTSMGGLFNALKGIGSGLINGMSSTLNAALLGDYEGLLNITQLNSGYEMVDGLGVISDIVGKVLMAPIAFSTYPIGLVVRGYQEVLKFTGSCVSDAEKVKIDSGAYGVFDVMNPSSEYWGGADTDSSGNPLSLLGKIGNKIYKLMMAPIVMFRSIMDSVTSSIDSVKGWFGEKLSKLKSIFDSDTKTPVTNPGGNEATSTARESNALNQRRLKYLAANPSAGMTYRQMSDAELTAAGFGKYGRGGNIAKGSDYEGDPSQDKKFYSQLDSKYSMQYNAAYDTQQQSMKDSGCGPVSASNVASVFGKNLDPRDAAKYALENGYKEKDGGTTPGFFGNLLGKIGIGTNYENNQGALQNLQQGNPVILMGQDTSVNGKNPYGPYPHYVVGTGMDGKGNVIVQDPESRTPNLKYKSSDVLSKTKLAISTNGYGLGKMNKILGKYGRGKGIVKNYGSIYGMGTGIAKYGLGGGSEEGIAAAIANGLLSTGVEGGADSVNPNDRGAPSIGMSQWHLDRAKNLLSMIPGGNAFIGFMDSPISQEVANQISSVIGSAEGQKAQLELLKNDCRDNYIPAIAEIGGITNGKVMVYIGMWMPTSTGVVQTFIRNRLNRIDINNLEQVHQIFKTEYNEASGGNNYGSRADQTYDYCKSLPDNLSNVKLDPSLAGKNGSKSQSKPKNKGIFGLFDDISSSMSSKLSGVMDPLNSSFNTLQEQAYGPMKKLLFGDDSDTGSSGSKTNNSGAKGQLTINSNAPDAQDWLASNIQGAQITAPFGEARTNSQGNPYTHTGVDIAADLGLRIPSPVSGTISDVGFENGYGNYTEVTDKDGRTHLFAHMNGLVRNIGEQVKKGEDLGPLGSTGHSTGPHVHYEVRQGGTPIDPQGLDVSGLGKNGLIRPKLDMSKADSKYDKTGTGGVDAIDYSTLLNTIVQLLTVIAQNTGGLTKLDESLSKSLGTAPEADTSKVLDSVKNKLSQALSGRNGTGDAFLQKDIGHILSTMQSIATA